MRFIQSVICIALVILASVAAGKDPPESKAAFSAILHTSTGNDRGFAASYGEFTLEGPQLDTFKPLPNGLRDVVYDPAGKQFYGISSHKIYKVDLKTAEKIEMKPPVELPELSWTCGIAFDAKRERVVVVTLGGVGHLYSYTPKTSEWALISDMNNLDLSALTYDEEADRLYGLHQPYGKKPAVLIINPKGAIVGEIELPDPIPEKLDPFRHGRPVHFLAVGKSLVLITPDQIFAVDLKTEKARVTWNRK